MGEVLPPHRVGRWPEGPEGPSPIAEEVSIDVLLDRLEAITARLAEAKEPIEDLVVAYENGVRLLADTQARLARLEEAIR
jgi:exonuclease VII small subunit